MTETEAGHGWSLADEQVAGYAAFGQAPTRAELERFFFLDDVDRHLVECMSPPAP